MLVLPLSYGFSLRRSLLQCRVVMHLSTEVLDTESIRPRHRRELEIEQQQQKTRTYLNSSVLRLYKKVYPQTICKSDLVCWSVLGRVASWLSVFCGGYIYIIIFTLFFFSTH